MFSRRASIAASRVRDSMSAPVYPSVSSASFVRSTDLSRTLFSCIFFVWIFRIDSRPSLFGTLTYTIRSNRPGRIRAGSRMSGRLVAPITITFVRSSIPSISAKSWFRTFSVTFVPFPIPPPRFPARESISSKKITQGETCRARSKIFRTPSSDFPTHILKRLGPLIWMKFASDSFATAFARRVLPVPGGP